MFKFRKDLYLQVFCFAILASMVNIHCIIKFHPHQGCNILVVIFLRAEQKQNKTRESEIKRNKTIIGLTQKKIILFSVGVNVNQYGCFLSLNAIRDLFDNINEEMLSNIFHSFSNRPF